MDRERFDALARVLAAKGSRRAAMAALLGLALFGCDPDEGVAKPGRGEGNGGGKGKRRNQKKRRDQQRSRGANSAHAEAAGCCGALSCAKPTKGANRQKCNYAS